MWSILLLQYYKRCIVLLIFFSWTLPKGYCILPLAWCQSWPCDLVCPVKNKGNWHMPLPGRKFKIKNIPQRGVPLPWVPYWKWHVGEPQPNYDDNLSCYKPLQLGPIFYDLETSPIEAEDRWAPGEQLVCSLCTKNSITIGARVDAGPCPDER